MGLERIGRNIPIDTTPRSNRLAELGAEDPVRAALRLRREAAAARIETATIEAAVANDEAEATATQLEALVRKEKAQAELEAIRADREERRKGGGDNMLVAELLRQSAESRDRAEERAQRAEERAADLAREQYASLRAEIERVANQAANPPKQPSRAELLAEIAAEQKAFDHLTGRRDALEAAAATPKGLSFAEQSQLVKLNHEITVAQEDLALRRESLSTERYIADLKFREAENRNNRLADQLPEVLDTVRSAIRGEKEEEAKVEAEIPEGHVIDNCPHCGNKVIIRPEWNAYDCPRCHQRAVRAGTLMPPPDNVVQLQQPEETPAEQPPADPPADDGGETATAVQPGELDYVVGGLL